MPVSSWAFEMPFQLSLQLERFLSSTRNPLFHLMIIVSLLVDFFKLIRELFKILFKLCNKHSDCFFVVWAFHFLKIHSSCKFCVTWDFACSLESHCKRFVFGFSCLFCYVFSPLPTLSTFLSPRKKHRHTFV